MTFTHFVPFVPILFALLATALGCVVFARLAPRFGFVDRPDATRKFQKRAIPVGGGAVVFLVSFAAFGLARLLGSGFAEPPRETFFAFAAAGAALVAVGLFDDRNGMTGVCKLFFQIAAATVVVAFADDDSKVELFGRDVELGNLFYPLVVCWLVGLINAINLLDGADGVVATVGFYIFVALGVVGFLNGDRDAATAAFIFAASLLGFFICNRPPARIYLGDAGSMFVGFAIGVLSLRACLTPGGSIQVVPALAIALVPFADVLFAIVRRRNSGRSVFSPDRGHIHHRLQRRFGRGYPLLVALAFVQIPFCLVGVAGIYRRDDQISALGSAAFLVALVASRIFGRDEIKILYFRLKYRLLKRFSPTTAPQFVGAVRPQGTIRWIALWEKTLAYLRTTSCVSVYLDVEIASLNEEFFSEWNDATATSSSRVDKNFRVKMTIPLTVAKRFVGRVGLEFDVDAAPFAAAAVAADKVRRDCLAHIEGEIRRKTAVAVAENRPTDNL